MKEFVFTSTILGLVALPGCEQARTEADSTPASSSRDDAKSTMRGDVGGEPFSAQIPQVEVELERAEGTVPLLRVTQPTRSPEAVATFAVRLAQVLNPEEPLSVPHARAVGWAKDALAAKPVEQNWEALFSEHPDLLVGYRNGSDTILARRKGRITLASQVGTAPEVEEEGFAEFGRSCLEDLVSAGLVPAGMYSFEPLQEGDKTIMDHMSGREFMLAASIAGYPLIDTALTIGTHESGACSFVSLSGAEVELAGTAQLQVDGDPAVAEQAFRSARLSQALRATDVSVQHSFIGYQLPFDARSAVLAPSFIAQYTLRSVLPDGTETGTHGGYGALSLVEPDAGVQNFRWPSGDSRPR